MVAGRRRIRLLIRLLRALPTLVLATLLFGQGSVAFGQSIWFAPRAPYPPAKIQGAPDFLDLFRTNAPWDTVSPHIKVIKLPTQFLTWVPDEQLAAIVADLRRRGIALAVESLAQSRVGQPPCADGVEGYGDPNQATIVATKIRRVGGQLRYLAMDEPLYFGHFYDGRTACHSSVDNVAERVAGIISAYRAVFPDVVVGDIEPAGAVLIPGWDQIFADWQSDFKKHVQAAISFFDIDVDWNNPNHLAAISRAAALARQRGLRLGVIYNGKDNDRSDGAWIADAKQNIRATENVLHSSPDDVIFQSWIPYPARLLPESDPNSFTSLISWYLRLHSKQ